MTSTDVPGPARIGEDPLRVALYSDDRTVRAQVIRTLGRKLARDLPELDIIEFATPQAVVHAMDDNSFDLAIFDAEAAPLGGMGLSMQIRDEIAFPPPVVLLVARAADAWLAAWSRAEAISPLPVDPIHLPNTVLEVLRADRAGRGLPLVEPLAQPGAASRHEATDESDEGES